MSLEGRDAFFWAYNAAVFHMGNSPFFTPTLTSTHAKGSVFNNYGDVARLTIDLGDQTVTNPLFYFNNTDASKWDFSPTGPISLVSGNRHANISGNVWNASARISGSYGCHSNGACGTVLLTGTYHQIVIDITEIDPSAGGDGMWFQICERSEPPPAPAIGVAKTVASGPTLNADGTYTVEYTISVENTGDAPGAYDLTDTPEFASSIAITSAEFDQDLLSDGSLEKENESLTGSGPWALAGNQGLAAGARDTYTLTVIVNISTAITAQERDCELQTGESGTGFRNKAGITVDNETTEATACVDVPAKSGIGMQKSVISVTVANGADPALVDAGDVITYRFEVTNTGNVYLTPVTISDSTLGLTDAACLDTLAPAVTATCTGTYSYTITAADITAGGVENVAVAKGRPSESNGTPIDVDGDGNPDNDDVTDSSDAGTEPQVNGGDPVDVTDPEGTETENPLGGNPNDPADPTDDPTTVLIQNPELQLAKSVSGVTVDKGANAGFVDAGDEITYGFTLTNTGNTHVAVAADAVTDAKLNVSCTPALLAPNGSTSCTAAPYVITQADVDAGGVENVAVASGTPTDENGTPLTDNTGAPFPPVTDGSDAGTDPDGNPVTDPEDTETPSPLGENPNDPDDPTDDPTTVMIQPVKSVPPKPAPPAPPSDPPEAPPAPPAPPTPPSDPPAESFGNFCLILGKEGKAESGVPDILPLDVPLWWDTAQGLFAASEMAGFAAEAADQKIEADRSGRQYQRLAGFMQQFARSNTGAYTMQSGLGITLEIDGKDLSKMAAQAGLDEVPSIQPIAVPYAGGLPIYRQSDGNAWATYQADRKITPAAIGAMLSAQARLLPDLATSSRASDRFTTQVMVQQMATTIAIINQLPVTAEIALGRPSGNGAFGKAYAMNRAGDFVMEQNFASVADQAMLLSGLLDARSAFIRPPKGLDGAVTKAWNALQSGFDAATGLYSDDGLLTADASMAITAALAALSGQHNDLPMADTARAQLAEQVTAVADKLITDDGAVLTAFDLKSDEADSGAKTLESAASVLAALLNHSSGIKAAKMVYGYMNQRLWDEKNDLYRDTVDWMVTGSFSARTMGAVVGGLGRLALLTSGDEQADVIDHLAQFVEMLMVKGGMQLDGKRGGYMDDPGSHLLNEGSSLGPRGPLPLPNRRLRDDIAETGLGDRSTATVLNSEVVVNFAPLEAEKLRAMVDGIDNRVERFGAHWPLYFEPERVPKLGNRMSEPAANLLAAIALTQVAPQLQAPSGDLGNGFTGRPVNLSVTADMLVDRSKAALAKVKGQVDSGVLTLEDLFPEATAKERQLLADAMAAPESADLTALAEIDLRPDNDARESLAHFAKPLLAATGDDLIEKGEAFDERYWSDRIGTYLADEQQETQVGVRTTRYMYTPDDIGVTVAALTRVLIAADGELADRLARRLVAFVTGILDDMGVRMTAKPADEIRRVDLYLVDRQRAYPGDYVEYTITVSNSDNSRECDEFTRLQVVDQLPDGARYVAGSWWVAGVPSDPVVQGGKLTWILDRLSAGESLTITFRVRLLEVDFESNQENIANIGTLNCLAQARDTQPLGKPGRIKGVLFVDADGDGNRGPGDRPLANIRVILDENRATDTDNTGTFWFEDLVPGVYQVRIDTSRLPVGLYPSNDPVHTVIVGETETYVLDVGLVSYKRLSGMVFDDLNGNGVRDDGEPGVGKVKVTVSGVPHADPGVYTAADGTFVVEGVPEKAAARLGIAKDQPYLTTLNTGLSIEME